LGWILVIHRNAERRAAFERLLRRLGNEVSGLGGTTEALRIVREQSPDVVVVDRSSGGLLLCRQIVELSPRTSVILVSDRPVSSSDRIAALLVGADDYLGEPYDREELLARAQRSCQRLPSRLAPPLASRLSRREQEVLELLTRGLTQRQIAAALVISPKTAGTHVQHILRKLGVHSSAQAVAVALAEHTAKDATVEHPTPA
jgi:DNA-binding NarL/FixJ family response regulator